jgi:hypothetical protein
MIICMAKLMMDSLRSAGDRPKKMAVAIVRDGS